MKGEVVVPGDFLVTEEEFVPGKNAFECDGSVCSSALGKAQFDTRQRTVSVPARREPELLRVGDIVFGEVILVRSNFIVLKLITSEVKSKVIHMTSATLPVRNASAGYVKDLSEAFKLGDIVRAKVASVMPWGIDLRTNEPDLGVVRAYCAACRHPLQLFEDRLKCLKCGSTADRKFSRDYLLK